MREKGVQLGRIFGIQIQLDWSWFFVFVLITWNLVSVFGESHPEWQVALQWGTAVAASLLFFASVLAHELAHSLVARAYGVPVRHITLMLFGGVAEIEGEPPSPRAEFLITVIGPIVSIFLGFFFLLMASMAAPTMNLETGRTPTAVIAQLSPVTSLLLWLGPINLLLGFFNLIPGFPLDGGRILRSILWAATGNLQKATRWAAGVGQGVAWLLILSGVSMIFGATIPFFGGGFINGLWLAFIGWFLNNAARQSYHLVGMRERVLENGPIAQIVRADPLVVPATMTLDTLMNEYVMNRDENVLPVEVDGQLVGLVTMADVHRIPRNQWPNTTVQKVMIPNNKLVTLPATANFEASLVKPLYDEVPQLSILDGNQFADLATGEVVE